MCNSHQMQQSLQASQTSSQLHRQAIAHELLAMQTIILSAELQPAAAEKILQSLESRIWRVNELLGIL